MSVAILLSFVTAFGFGVNSRRKKKRDIVLFNFCKSRGFKFKMFYTNNDHSFAGRLSNSEYSEFAVVTMLKKNKRKHKINKNEWIPVDIFIIDGKYHNYNREKRIFNEIPNNKIVDHMNRELIKIKKDRYELI